jgi:hypothetical protein
MDNASESIITLRPVSFRYKVHKDTAMQFGLIANLVIYDAEGKPYTVRYEAVNAMLLNEFLKARHQIDAQQKQIEELTAAVQKVSAQLELNKPAPQVADKNQ